MTYLSMPKRIVVIGEPVKMRHRFAGVFVLAAVLVLWGCATPKKAEKPTKATEVQQDNATTPLLEPVEALGEIMMPQKGEEAPAEKQRLYTLQMKEADVQDLLLAFSAQTGFSIFIDPRVSGTVTIDLKKVTLEQALDTILSPLDLKYEQQGNLVKVFKPKMKTRIFYLNYITTVRTGEGLVSGAIGGRGGDQQTGGGSAGNRQSGSGGYSEVESTDESDLWAEIATGLVNLKSEKGGVTINKASNSIIVVDYPLYIQRIADFLDAIEGAVQRQVIIEASIMEVSLDDRFEAGINWQVIQNLPNMSNFQWGLASRGATPWLGYSGGQEEDTGGNGGGVGGDTTQIPGRTTIRPFSGLLSIGTMNQAIRLTDVMEALSTQGDVDILSNPRVSTLNNQPAIIKVATEDVYFQTIRTTTAAESTTESTVNFLTVGIVLSVTPQISADGIITMTIHPSITEKAGEKQSSQGDSVPIINVRETETVARVRNNQTILIGGLMQDKVTETVVGVPVLRDLPFLGKLFRHVTREKVKKELVIMLTPRILTGETIEAISSLEVERIDKRRTRVR